MRDETWVTVFESGRQGRKVRLLWWGLGVASIACMYAAFLLLGHPALTDKLWGVAVAALGLAAFGGMEVYRRHYVMALEVTHPATHIRLTTASWGRPVTKVISHANLLPADAHAGVWRARGMFGAAPWLSLPTTAHRIPYILDMGGHILRPAVLAKLLDAPWIRHLKGTRPD